MTGAMAVDGRDVGPGAIASAIEELVAEVTELTFPDLPTALQERGSMILVDSIGVMLAGAREPEVRALGRDPSFSFSVEPKPGRRSLLLDGTGRYGDAATVAWMNGTSGSFLELDEGYRPTGHPGMHIVPAAFAVAQEYDRSVQELVVAITAGYEVAARLFESFKLPGAWHPHGHLGSLGAATAVAMLTEADPLELVAIAATQPLLTGWAACYEGATARNTWMGHANRVGVLSRILRRAGFRGSLSAYAEVLTPWVVEGASLHEPVDKETLRSGRNYFKFHSACALTHSALDATLAAWGELGTTDPGTVREIDVETIPVNARVARQAEPNDLSTRFSLPYAIATAILNRATTPAAFRWDGRVAQLARRVTVRVDPAMAEAWPENAPARVRISTGSRVAEAMVSNPHGHHSRPPRTEQLRDKFVSLLLSTGYGAPSDLGATFEEMADTAAARSVNGWPSLRSSDLEGDEPTPP